MLKRFVGDTSNNKLTLKFNKVPMYAFLILQPLVEYKLRYLFIK